MLTIYEASEMRGLPSCGNSYQRCRYLQQMCKTACSGSGGCGFCRVACCVALSVAVAAVDDDDDGNVVDDGDSDAATTNGGTVNGTCCCINQSSLTSSNVPAAGQIMSS
jgi:hypothetical protein